MDRRIAKLLRRLAKDENKTQRSVKREYYALNDKDRFLLKKALKKRYPLHPQASPST